MQSKSDAESEMESAESESIVDDSTVDDDGSTDGDTDEDTESGEDTESEEEEEEDDPWEIWIEGIFKMFQEPMRDRVTELEDTKGLTPKAAQSLTVIEFLPFINKGLQKKVIHFSNLSHRLKHDPTYQKIMQTAKRAREEDDMDFEESVTHAAKRRKLLLDRVILRWTPDLDEVEDSD
jgi:hypothetical protein